MLLTETGDPGGELRLKWRHNESRLEHAELDVLIEIPSKQGPYMESEAEE